MRGISILGALATFVALMGTAHAVQEEVEYANLGHWRIITVSEQGRFLYCAADTDNDQVTLRIATDGKMWQLGVPFYDDGPVKGQWGFDGWEDEAMFQTHGDGWATMEVNQHVLDSLRQLNNFSIELDRGPQDFALQGSSAALTKAVECARGKGSSQPADAGGGIDVAGASGTYFPQPVSAALEWVQGWPGQPVDDRALAVGTMPDGLPVFVCAGFHNGGLHPGMTGVWIEGCSVGYGGREFHVTDFNLLIGAGVWASSAYGQVPANAVLGGHEANGAELYVCRAQHEGGVYAGKTRPGFNGCNITDLGREITVRTFDVLIPARP